MARSRVLVIDDNLSFVQLVSSVLEDDFDVLSAASGELGIETAQKVRPDVILLDVNMPGISGLDVVQALQSAPGLAGIPVLVLTATEYNIVNSRVLSGQPNVKGFMTKLSPMSSIKEKVVGILAQSKK